jgi:hypothetical protein
MAEPDLTLSPLTFGRPNAGSVTGWDQFETNRQMFQVIWQSRLAAPEEGDRQTWCDANARCHILHA